MKTMISTLAALLVVPLLVFANEAAAPAKGSGSSSATTVAPWAETEANIAGLKAKMAAQEGNILKLLEEKRNLQGDPKKFAILKAKLKTEYKDLKDSHVRYNRELNNLNFRFPERYKRASTEVKQRKSVQTLEAIEKQMSLDEVLTETLNVVTQKYGYKNSRAKAKDAKRSLSSVEDESLDFPVLTVEK